MIAKRIRRTSGIRLVLHAVVLLVFTDDPCGAAESLATYLPPETAMFVELRHVDRDWTKFDNSPFGERWKDSRLRGSLLQSQAGRRWDAANARVQEATGQSLTAHLRGMFSDSVSLALVIPERGEPQALMLSRGRSAAEMRATIDHWNRIESNIRLEERQASGHSYVQRLNPAANAPHYYALVDNVFLFSDREEFVTQILQRISHAKTPVDQQSLAGLPEFKAAWTPAADALQTRVFVNCRQWDRLISPGRDQSVASRAFAKNWDLTNWIRLRATINEQGLAFDGTAVFDPMKTSEGWKATVRATASPLGILEAAPENSLLVMGGSFEPVPLLEGLRGLMNDFDRKKWDRGLSVVKSLLLGESLWDLIGRPLLADWGFYIAAYQSPHIQKPRLHPFVGVWQSRFQQSELTDEELLAMENGLSFMMNALLVAANSKEQGPRLTLRRQTQFADLEWKWLLTGSPEADLAVTLSRAGLTICSREGVINSPIERQQNNTTVEPAFTKMAKQEFGSSRFFALFPVQNWARSADTGLSFQGWLAALVPPAGDVVSALVELFDSVYFTVECAEDALTLRARAIPLQELVRSPKIDSADSSE